MKTPLRVVLTLIFLSALAVLELYLHAEAPYKALYGQRLPAWAPAIEVYIGLTALFLVLPAITFFRALAGFKYPVNGSVMLFSTLVPLTLTGLHAAQLLVSLPVAAAVWFVLALMSAWLCWRAFKMDVPAGLAALPLPVLSLGGLVLFVEASGLLK